MAKPLTCNKYVARGIKKYGLASIQAAIEMAVDLTSDKDEIVKKLREANKPKAAVSTPSST